MSSRVLPGVLLATARARRFVRELIRVDFPELDLPANAISGSKLWGKSCTPAADLTNSADLINSGDILDALSDNSQRGETMRLLACIPATLLAAPGLE